MTTLGSLAGKRKTSDEAENHRARTTPGRERTAAASRKRVLIVDDNDTVRDVLAEFLNDAYAVDLAANAATALHRLSTHPADLIMLDVNMPGTDGLTLLESIRDLGITAPIFVITGYDSENVSRRATESGATAYLVKPVDLRSLDAMIAQALGVPPVLAG